MGKGLEPGWRVSVAIGEGVRNWWHGRVVTTVFTLIIAAMMALPIVGDTLAVSNLVRDERTWESAGGNLLVVSGGSQSGGVSRRVCEGAVQLEGVVSSAALTRIAERTGLRNAPDAELPVVAAGEGVARLLGVRDHLGGAVLPRQIAEQIAVGAGDTLWLSGAGSEVPEGPIAVGSVAETDLLGAEYAYAILLPTAASGTADVCFVEVEPGYRDAAIDMLPALFAVEATDVVVSSRLVTGAHSRDFSAEYESRSLRDAPWAVGAGIAVLWALMVWIRRHRDGLYTTLGADFATRAVIRVSEGIVLVSVAAAIAVIGSGAALVVMNADFGAPLAGTLRQFVVTYGVAIAGVVASTLIPLPGTLAALKDR